MFRVVRSKSIQSMSVAQSFMYAQQAKRFLHMTTLCSVSDSSLRSRDIQTDDHLYVDLPNHARFYNKIY
jgi:non-ribosomal peptide synthetase component E (peptide arylation enzyme)